MSNHPGTSASGPSRIGTGGSGATRKPATDRGGRIDRPLILAEVARDARLSREFLLLVVLSTAIAVVGMLQNNMVVVIGAMLVSPFLGPIMAFGFGLAIIDAALIRRALITLSVGIATAIALTMVILLFSPMQDVTAEFRSRTQPTLFDLAVAVLGGVAGVYAIMRKLSGVMVGVAIATALVPPLCTVAFGVVMGRPDFAFGAALLFLTNTFAIAFSAMIIARLNHFGPSLTPKQTALQLVGVFVTLGVLSIPLAVSLKQIAREVIVRNTSQAGLESLLGPNDRVDTLTVTPGQGSVRVDGVVLVDRYRPDLSKRLAQNLGRSLGRPVTAALVQIRQQTDGSQFQDAFDRRLTALERRDAETARVLSALMAGGAIPREAITLDSQARRVVVTFPPADGDQDTGDWQQVLNATALANPAWLIRMVPRKGETDAGSSE